MGAGRWASDSSPWIRVSAGVLTLLIALAVVASTAGSASADGAGSNALRDQAALMDVGGSHSCKVLEHGSVRCWGDNAHGQLGNANTVDIGDDEAPASADPVSLGAGRSATAITVGDDHTCAILDNGAVSCWGLNSEGQLGYGDTTQIGDDETPGSAGAVDLGTGRTAIQISAGGAHTCALLDDGSVRCWGRGAQGQLGYGDTQAVGDNETPASAGPVDLGAGRYATAISAGTSHTCALLDDGSVRCWGEGDSGRLGYGNTDDVGDGEAPGSVGPVSLGAGRSATAISAGGAHTCALLDNGGVRCWGSGTAGQLGYGNGDDIGDNETPASAGPVALGGGFNAVAITTGAQHTCARLANGTLRCWGEGDGGRLGYGNTNDIGDTETPASAPTIDVGAGRLVVAVSAGGAHTCARLENGSVRCWGAGGAGRLGYGTQAAIGDNEAPGTVGPVNLGVDPRATLARNVVDITAGLEDTCALLDDGNVRCWGEAGMGQLGYGNTNDIGDTEMPGSAGPVDLGAARTATRITSGDVHTCALLDNGSVRCWGNGGQGRLGYGNTATIGDGESPASVGPVDLGSNRSAVDISAGGTHTCALLDNGTVRCWGSGAAGQLGYGNTDNIGDGETPGSVAPVDLGSGRLAVGIEAGGAHTCALLDDGSVLCWGDGASGRLGYGDTSDVGDNEAPGSIGPVSIGDELTRLDIGSAHTCARLADGTVRCWGSGGVGQLGYGNTATVGDNESPGSVPVVNLGAGVAATEITLGTAHTCARLGSGAVKCWGQNNNGQLGYGNTSVLTSPPVGTVDLGAGHSALRLAAGGAHNCAVLETRGVRCWGFGEGGRLGYGNTATIGDDEAPGSVAFVDAIDDPPTAVDDFQTIDEDETAVPIEVLLNENDPDAGPLRILHATDPAHGTVTITGGGSGLAYTPSANYCNSPGGPLDTFGYTINGGSSATATITVTCIDDAPVAIADEATVRQGSAATSIPVLANDTDSDGGPRAIIATTDPAHGTVTVANGGGGLSYRPDSGYCNSTSTSRDTFTYTLNGDSKATVTMRVTCGTVVPPPGDTTPPNTSFTATPKAKLRTKKRRIEVTFGFASSEAGSTFQCVLDGGAFAPCTSPETIKVARGRHTFAVRAIDAAKNADPTPASFTFTVKKKR